MTNQYMTKLYHDLLSNSPQTVTIDIPADMGTGQISQVVTRCCCIRLENELFFRYECAGCKLRRLYSTFILLQCGFIGCFQARIKDRESTRILQNSKNIHGLRP
mgnify:CR=1 FL=1